MEIGSVRLLGDAKDCDRAGAAVAADDGADVGKADVMKAILTAQDLADECGILLGVTMSDIDAHSGIGGLTGLYGVMLFSGLMLTDLCAVAPFGVPYSAPVSPFVGPAQRDTVWRSGWKKLGRSILTVKEMKFE